MGLNNSAFGIPGTTPVFPVSEWQRSFYNPSSGTFNPNQLYLDFSPFGTSTYYEVLSRRVGDELQIKGWATAGTTTGGTAFLHLPAGLEIDKTKLFLNVKTIVGLWFIMNNTSKSFFADGFGGVTFVDPFTDARGVSVFFATNTDTQDIVAAAGNTVPTGGNLTFEFSVPIKGWST